MKDDIETSSLDESPVNMFITAYNNKHHPYIYTANNTVPFQLIILVQVRRKTLKDVTCIACSGKLYYVKWFSTYYIHKIYWFLPKKVYLDSFGIFFDAFQKYLFWGSIKNSLQIVEFNSYYKTIFIVFQCIFLNLLILLDFGRCGAQTYRHRYTGTSRLLDG